jgi:hypothetical protein
LYFLLGIVAFRQHLQNLARTKGILELNKVQLLYEQMGSEADPNLASAAPQLQDLTSSCPQVVALALPTYHGSEYETGFVLKRGVSLRGCSVVLDRQALKENPV